MLVCFYMTRWSFAVFVVCLCEQCNPAWWPPYHHIIWISLRPWSRYIAQCLLYVMYALAAPWPKPWLWPQFFGACHAQDKSSTVFACYLHLTLLIFACLSKIGWPPYVNSCCWCAVVFVIAACSCVLSAYAGLYGMLDPTFSSLGAKNIFFSPGRLIFMVWMVSILAVVVPAESCLLAPNASRLSLSCSITTSLL